MSSPSPGALQIVLTAVLILATAVWLGGWVTLVIVARTTSATLEPHDRVAFFRRFGRSFGTVATIALLVAVVCGAILLFGMPWNGLSTAIVILTVALLVALAVGVVQARRMTRLRHASLESPDDHDAAARIRRGGRAALVLRAGIGVLSLAVYVLAIVRAS